MLGRSDSSARLLNKMFSANDFYVVDTREEKSEHCPTLRVRCVNKQGKIFTVYSSSFWTNFKVWLQYCQVIAKETPLEPVIALGLRPDGSKNKLQINFCCFNAKFYIWLCRQKKCSPKLNNFLQYLKHIYL